MCWCFCWDDVPMNGMNIWRGSLVNALISHMHICTAWMFISWLVSDSGIDRHRQSAKPLCTLPLSPDLLQSSHWEFREPFPSISPAVLFTERCSQGLSSWSQQLHPAGSDLSHRYSRLSFKDNRGRVHPHPTSQAMRSSNEVRACCCC